MCWPQPVQVGRPQVSQVIRWHMVRSFLAGGEPLAGRVAPRVHHPTVAVRRAGPSCSYYTP